MPDYDVVVIGAGNGGLTAAAGLAKRGHKTLLLERHNVPGGCATSFIRGRFEFEVALHQLSGMGFPEFPGPLRGVLADLGVVDKIDFIQQKNLYRVVVPGTMDINLKAERASAQETLIEKYPAEKDGIIKFFDLLYAFCLEAVNVLYMNDPEAGPAKYPLFFQLALKDTQGILDEYLKDQSLQNAVAIYWSYAGLPPSRLSFMEFAMTLWAYLEFKPWHMKGGSQAMSNAICDAFINFGGDVRFNCAARKINVVGGKIKSVITEDGDEISTEYVVSNAGPITTLIDLIGAENCPADELKTLNARTVGLSAFTVYMGFDCDPSEMGIDKATNFICSTTDADRAYRFMKTLDGAEYSLLTCYDVDDPDFSPRGACQASLVTLQYMQPWLTVPPEKYYDAKYRFADKLIDLAAKVFPDLRKHLEEAEPATPLTHMRYLGHPGGSIYGSEHFTRETGMFLQSKSMIQGLHFTGAWNGSGGFQPTLQSGASAARQVSRLLKMQ
ncbi:MAG: NAD(P)/FAD-dependent oxidoreductase [Deltaproteobacteria bacterium HGW-Deltaproteobacteria-12]|jgi:prolycopene isomerase|nr:MAG: NAD(P)/FAD-dependent oxidoreductase [Deltaproteobacteria bacterium HGW-Deltaproteobacteria-12]